MKNKLTERPRELDLVRLYGQLFTRFATFGLPNPVAKSQPLFAG